MYHSHVDEHRDPNTGLVGPMIITARGQAKPDGTPQGVDREFVVMFVQDHEEDSWHAEENLPANMSTEPALLVLMTPFSATGTYPPGCTLQGTDTVTCSKPGGDWFGAVIAY